MTAGDGVSAEQMINYTNEVQAYVESQPLGIPFVFCCDPSTGTGLSASGAYAKKNTMEPMGDWPFSLGLSALTDEDTIKEIGSMHAEEYKACGFRMLLGPMCDPLGDPRWARAYDTFGTDPKKAGKFAKAYIQGLQQTDDGSKGQLVSWNCSNSQTLPRSWKQIWPVWTAIESRAGMLCLKAETWMLHLTRSKKLLNLVLSV